jgi:hypothetical protein
MDAKQTYKGYQLIDATMAVGEGIYVARVVVVRGSEAEPPDQHFLDFESFTSIDAARLRAIDGAVSWIDQELARAKFLMPARFR